MLPVTSAPRRLVMPSPQGSEVIRRRLLAAGTGVFSSEEIDDLKEVPEEIQTIQDLFDGFGFDQEPEANDLDHDNLLTRCSDFRKSAAAGDVLVAYYTSHGVRDQERFYLLTSDSDPKDLDGTAVAAEDLARRLIKKSKARQVLIILDMCFAGEGLMDIANLAARIAGDKDPELYVIAAAGIKQTAQQSAFANALTAVLRNVGERLAGKAQPYIQVGSLLAEINACLDKAGLQQARWACVNSVGECLALPNPLFRIPPGLDLETQGAFEEHWIPKARSAEMGVAGWYFTGREEALRQLVAWLREPRSDGKARVVTGSAGTGKSALLARLVTLSDPRWREEVMGSGSTSFPPETLPPVGVVNAAVVVRHKLLTDVVADLASQLSLEKTNPTGLRESITAMGKKTVLVVDALDEADERQSIVEELLRPLAEVPHVFLLLGTRPDPQAYSRSSGHQLEAFAGASVELDLDDPTYGNPADVTEYIRRRLLATEEPGRTTPYQSSPEQADEIAKALAKRIDHSFLVARTVVSTLLGRSEALDISQPGWQEQLPSGFEEALEQFLQQLDDSAISDLSSAIARAVLLALAFSEGEGLPWVQIWAPVASAISDMEITDMHITNVRRQAAPFIVEALENGGSVYRLFHERAAEVLRDSVDQKKAQIAIVSTLRDLVQFLPTGELDWTTAHPYIRSHLATHAGKAGCIGDLTQDLGFLTASDPKRLLTALEGAKEEGLETITAVVRLALPHLLGPDQGSNAAYLTFAALKLQVRDLAEALKSRRGNTRWWPRAMQWTSSSSHSLLKPSSAVRALALGSHNGMPCLANGGDDGKIQLWNLETLEAIKTFDAKAWVGTLAFDGSTLTAGLYNKIGFICWSLEDPTQPDVQTGTVEVKALGSFGMQTVAIVKSFPPVREILQPATLDVVSIPDLQQIAEIWTSALARQGSYQNVFDFRFQSFALGMAGDEPCLAHAHGNSILLYKGDGSRLVLDLSSVQTRDPRENIVNCLAVGSYGGRPAVAAGSNSGAVRVWDVQSLLLLAVFQDDDNYIDAVAIGELHGRPVAISGSRSNTIRILYPTAHGHASNDAHQGTVWCIALFDGLLASWGRDQTLRFWDADTMQPVAKPLRMASGEGSVALCRLDDQTSLITGSGDGVVRWDWRQGMRITERPKTPVDCMAVAFRAGKMVILTGNDAGLIEVLDATSLRPVCTSLQATTDGSMGVQTLKVVFIGKRTQVLSAGSAKIIERWDLETLRPIGSPLKGHDSVIYEIASFTMGDAVMLASCSFDRTIRLWDLQSGLQHGSPLSGHQSAIGALAAGSWEGDIVLVSGDRAGDLKIWNSATTELLLELSLDSWIHSLVMGEGKVFVGCGHGILQIELI